MNGSKTTELPPPLRRKSITNRSTACSSINRHTSSAKSLKGFSRFWGGSAPQFFFSPPPPPPKKAAVGNLIRPGGKPLLALILKGGGGTPYLGGKPPQLQFDLGVGELGDGLAEFGDFLL